MSCCIETSRESRARSAGRECEISCTYRKIKGQSLEVISGLCFFLVQENDVVYTPIFDSQIYQNTAESLILPGFFSGVFSFYYIVFFLNQIWMIDFYDFSRDCLLSFWISFIFLLVRNS